MSDKVKVGFIMHQTKVDPESAKRRLVDKAPSALRPVLRPIPAPIVYRHIMPQVPVRLLRLGRVTGIKSSLAETEAILWAVPFGPDQMMDRQPIGKVIQAVRHCARKGAEIVGLGAYTSIIGEHGGGQDVANAVESDGIAITSGNSLTAGTGGVAALEVAQRVGLDPSECTLAVIGASGSTGKVLAQLMSREVKKVLLVGRSGSDLSDVQREVGANSEQVGLDAALQRSQILITVTNSAGQLRHQIKKRLKSIRSGAILCDIARPRDIGHEVADERPDILVIDGGVLHVPGENYQCTYNYGFPHQLAYACMCETYILGLEKRTGEHYSLGRELELDKVQEMLVLMCRHGFKLESFRAFDEEIPDERIDAIREIIRTRRVEGHAYA